MPGLFIVRRLAVRPQEPRDVISHVLDIPPKPVQLQELGQRRDAGPRGVGGQDGAVAGVEIPQVAFGRRDEHGVPVDQPPAVRGQHRVPRMRLAMGEHGAIRMRPRDGHELVVPVKKPLDPRRVLPDERRDRPRVRPAVFDTAGAGRLELIPERHRELLGQRPHRRRVHGRHHPEHPAPPLRRGVVTAEALPVGERVDGDGEPLAQPQHRLAARGRRRGDNELAAGVPQAGGRAQRRPQPPEPVIERLALTKPLVRHLVNGDKPPPAAAGDLPVMAAPPDGQVAHLRDAQSPPELKRFRERSLGKILRCRQHGATLLRTYVTHPNQPIRKSQYDARPFRP